MKYDLILYSGFYRYTFIFILYTIPTKIPPHYVTIPLFLRKKGKKNFIPKRTENTHFLSISFFF